MIASYEMLLGPLLAEEELRRNEGRGKRSAESHT